jgi:hypothetical protein
MKRATTVMTASRWGRSARMALATLSLAALAAIQAVPSHAALVSARLYASGLTAPPGGLVLPLATGATRLWVSDHINGFCRLDPNPAVPGTATLNTSTCYNFGLGGAAGQPAFDPVNNFIYLPDLSKKSAGITRLKYNPTTGTVTVSAVIGQTLAASLPDAVALGPDGKLYVSFKGNGSIVRITNPGSSVLSLQAIESVGRTSDNRLALNIAFVGTDMYLAEKNLLTIMPGATTCTGACIAFFNGINIAVPQSVVFDGKYLFVGDTNSVWRIDPATLTPVQYATNMANVSGIAVKVPTVSATGVVTPGNVFAMWDPSAGIQIGQGRVWVMPYK